jgi:hypothetical protein
MKMEFGVGGRLDIHLTLFFCWLINPILFSVREGRTTNRYDLRDQSKTKASRERTKGN